jgi:ABC-type uncharacterized transport system permease subunit
MRRRYVVMTIASMISGLCIGLLKARFDLSEDVATLLALVAVSTVCLIGFHGYVDLVESARRSHPARRTP